MAVQKSSRRMFVGLGLLFGGLLGVGVCVANSLPVAGLLDTSFGNHCEQLIKVGPGARLGQLIPLPAGRLLAVGTTAALPITGRRVALARLLANGARDLSFGSAGKALGPVGLSGNAVVLGARSKLIIGGAMQFGAPNYPERAALSRYTSSGTLDRSFGSRGIVLLDLPGDSTSIDAMVPDARGRLLALVNRQRLTPDNGFMPAATAIVRLNFSGALDRSFGANGVAELPSCLASARTLLRQPEGRIIVGGTAPEPTPDACSTTVPLVRLLPSGRPDQTFGNGGIARLPAGAPSLFGGVAAILRQPDGKLIVGGSFRARFAIMRFQAGGRIDRTFGRAGAVVTGAGPGGSKQSGSAQVLALLRQSDGKIIVGGEAASRQTLARLTASGWLDRSFGNGGTVIVRRPFDRVSVQAVNWMFSPRPGRLVTGGTLYAINAVRFDIAQHRAG
jgi:uncharacterized delta-60 repeat protein